MTGCNKLKNSIRMRPLESYAPKQRKLKRLFEREREFQSGVVVVDLVCMLVGHFGEILSSFVWILGMSAVDSQVAKSSTDNNVDTKASDGGGCLRQRPACELHSGVCVAEVRRRRIPGSCIVETRQNLSSLALLT